MVEVEGILNISFSVYSLRLCGVAKQKQNKNDLDVVVLVEVGVARVEKSIHWTCLEDVNIKKKNGTNLRSIN